MQPEGRRDTAIRVASTDAHRPGRGPATHRFATNEPIGPARSGIRDLRGVVASCYKGPPVGPDAELEGTPPGGWMRCQGPARTDPTYRFSLVWASTRTCSISTRRGCDGAALQTWSLRVAGQFDSPTS